MSATEKVLLIAGIALLGGAFYKVGILPVMILFVGMGIGAVCVRRFEYALALLLGGSLGFSYRILLDLRPTVGDVSLPVTALDFLGFLVFVSMFLGLVGRRESLALPRHLILPYVLFLFVTFFGLAYGLLSNGGSMSTYLRDGRLFFTIHLCLLGTAWFVRHPKQLRFLAVVLILAGIGCACQQNWRLFAMGSMGVMGIRDVFLPVQILSIAVTFLIIYRHHGIRLCPPNTFPFLLTFLLLALLVSFTRSAWVMMVLSYALCLQYMGAKQRGRSILLALGAIAVLIFVVPFVSSFFSHGMSLQSLMEERYKQIVNNNDIGTQARMVSSASAWTEYTRSPVIGLGVGFPIYTYDIEKRTTVEDTNLHNSLLFYAIKIGAVGVVIMIWLIVAAMRRMSRTASSKVEATTPAQIEVKAFAQSLFAGFVPVASIGIWSGNLNYIVFMPLLGMTLGIHWDKLAAITRPVSSGETSGPPARETFVTTPVQ